MCVCRLHRPPHDAAHTACMQAEPFLEWLKNAETDEEESDE